MNDDINIHWHNGNINDCINDLYKIYSIVSVISLDTTDLISLQYTLQNQWKPVFLDNERIILTITADYYDNYATYGIILKSVQTIINNIDISNYFITIVTTNTNINKEYQTIFATFNNDPVPIDIYSCKQGQYTRNKNNSIISIDKYNVLSLNNHNINDYTLSILNTNKNFCILPWIRLHISNNGNAYPCCLFSKHMPLSDANIHSLKHIFNNANMRKLRVDMLEGKVIEQCDTCNTFNDDVNSLRNMSNQRFLHHINGVQNTSNDGYYNFKLKAWDLRFSNLCNLKCRTCNPISSSSWNSDAILLGEPGINTTPPKDILEQYMDIIDDVEQIYFAGGEPLIIDECWEILLELYNKGYFGVELVYNTNFTQIHYKNKNIFKYWKKFDSVYVGASLDASYKRGEYWRSGTNWSIIEQNRQKMIEQCPNATFNIDATVSIVNALHIVDFHREWVNKGLISAGNFYPKILKTPHMFSLLQCPPDLKLRIKEKYAQHLVWLNPLDTEKKSVSMYNAIINVLDENNITFDKIGFWEKINEVDNIRNEKLLNVFPELELLK